MSAILEAGGERAGRAIEPGPPGEIMGTIASKVVPDLSDPTIPYSGKPELQFAAAITKAAAEMRETIAELDEAGRRQPENVALMWFGPKRTAEFFTLRSAIGLVFDELGLTDRYYAAQARSTADGGLGSWKFELPRHDKPGIFTVHYAHSPAGTSGRLQYLYAARP